MSAQTIVVKVFSNEIDAGMAQQVLRNAELKCFVLKDDAGGMEPHLQLTGGVSLVVNRVDAAKARELLKTLETSA